MGALATNKLQASMGTATSALMMLRHGRVKWKVVNCLIIVAFIGAVVGALLVQIINTDMLEVIIPVALCITGIYFLLTPTKNEENKQPKLSSVSYQKYIVPAIGVYDGILGPGTGSFFTLAGRVCRAQTFLQATATAKILNCATNIGSLFVFLFFGQILWSIGIIMMVGQSVGAWIASHCLFRISIIYLRILVVIMCTAMLIRYVSH